MTFTATKLLSFEEYLAYEGEAGGLRCTHKSEITDERKFERLNTLHYLTPALSF